jgi:hypothetical protein
MALARERKAGRKPIPLEAILEAIDSSRYRDS